MSSRQARLQRLTNRLRARGYRLTPQRLAVLNIVAMSEEHPSVEEIHRQIQRDYPTTSRATVYNTIDLLRQMGEVLELPFSGGSSRYDGRNPEPHPHLICTGCGRIADLDIDVAGMAQAVAHSTGYAQIKHRLEFYGVCPRCQEEGAAVAKDRNASQRG